MKTNRFNTNSHVPLTPHGREGSKEGRKEGRSKGRRKGGNKRGKEEGFIVKLTHNDL